MAELVETKTLNTHQEWLLAAYHLAPGATRKVQLTTLPVSGSAYPSAPDRAHPARPQRGAGGRTAVVAEMVSPPRRRGEKQRLKEPVMNAAEPIRKTNRRGAGARDPPEMNANKRQWRKTGTTLPRRPRRLRGEDLPAALRAAAWPARQEALAPRGTVWFGSRANARATGRPGRANAPIRQGEGVDPAPAVACPREHGGHASSSGGAVVAGAGVAAAGAGDGAIDFPGRRRLFPVPSPRRWPGARLVWGGWLRQPRCALHAPASPA